MHNNTHFGTCLYSISTQHGSLLKSLVIMTMSRVAYFSLWAHLRNCISQKQGEDMEEHETPGSGLSMQSYVQTFSKLGRTFLSSVFSTVGSELLHTVPHCEFFQLGRFTVWLEVM